MSSRTFWVIGLSTTLSLALASLAQAEATPAPPPAEAAAETSIPLSEVDCLALNVYWEARSESRTGQAAVAAVTLNRVAHPAFPDTVCDVVKQGEDAGRHRCQFSWLCDGRDDTPRETSAWQRARVVARLALARLLPDPTRGALWYHADHVRPGWSQSLALITQIGGHLFYAEPHPD